MTTAPHQNEKPEQPWLAYKKAMVIVAHPDDAEFGFGATLAKLVKEGMELAYVLCTNGDKGSSDPEMTSLHLAIIREQEQRAAAAVIGTSDVTLLATSKSGTHWEPRDQGLDGGLVSSLRALL